MPLVPGTDRGGDEREHLCDRLVPVRPRDRPIREGPVIDPNVEVVPAAQPLYDLAEGHALEHQAAPRPGQLVVHLGARHDVHAASA